MKKVILGCSVMFAASLLFLTGCNKKTNTPPEQDTELQSSSDVAFANSTAMDVDMVCGYLGEQIQSFFVPAAGSQGTISQIQFDTAGAAKKLTINFTNSVTCLDGHKRNGQIVLTYNGASAASKFYRRPGFTATVSLNNYFVDDYQVVCPDPVGSPFIITNTTPFALPVPTEKLRWEIKGNIYIRNWNDSTKNLTWKGTFVKTLTNSDDNRILKKDNLAPINWSVTYSVNGTPNPNTPGAIVEYTGESEGVTSRIIPYKFKIDQQAEGKPLVRRFDCAPEKVVGVLTTPSFVPQYSEWHPFIGGVATFTTGVQVEPRYLDFGNDGAMDCDNSGKVTIKGIEYPVDFRK